MNKNRKFAKVLCKNAICIILSSVLTLGSVFVFQKETLAFDLDPKDTIKSGVEVDVKYSKFLVSYNDKALVLALDVLADVTRCDTIAQIADWVTIKDKDESAHEEIMQSLDEIKDMIEDLQLDMHDLFSSINDSLTAISAKADSKNLSDARSKLSGFANESGLAMERYEDYIDAARVYGETLDRYEANPSKANQDAVDKAAEDVSLRIKEFCDRAKGIDFEKTMRDMSENSSSQRYSYSLTRKQITQDSNNIKTALYYADLLASESFAFEHMKYQFMLDEARWEQGLYTYIMQANNVWVEFLEYYQSLPEDMRRKLDPKLDLDYRNLRQEADTLEIVLNIGFSCVNNISEQFNTYAGKLMRPYDIDRRVKVQYSPSYTYDDQRWGTLGTFNFVHTSYADKTSPEMDFYLVKPLNNSSDATYLILKNGINGPKTDADLVYFSQAQALANKHNVAYYSGMTQDFYNLQLAKEQQYRMPTTIDEFNGLINPSSFSLSNNNMLNYLTGYGGLDRAQLNGKMNIGLLNDWEKAPSQAKITTKTAHFYCHYRVADLNKYNAMSPKDSKKDIQASQNFGYGVLATMAGPSRSKQSFSFSNTSSAQLSPAPSGDKYVPGTLVTATYTPSNERDHALALIDSDGNVLESLLDGEMYDIFKDENGKVEVVFSTPYQDFKLVPMSTGASLVTQSAKTMSAMSVPEDKPADTFNINLMKTDSIPVFTDIEDSPAKEDIELLAGYGIVSGTGEGEYSPDSVMTRDMFVAVLSRLTNADMSNYRSSNFSDISPKDPMRPYIEWAYKHGFVMGHNDWKFMPDSPITREQMALIIYGFANRAGIELAADAKGQAPYADDDSISPWAKDAVYAIKPTGIISDAGENMFNPKGMVTRADVATMIAALINKVTNK